MVMGKKLLSFIFVLLGATLLSGCGFKDAAPEAYEVELEVWGVFDNSDAYSSLFSDYSEMNPFVKSIKYRKLSIDTYKTDLLNALAAGNGPDVFMIRNAWRGAFEDKIAPAPDFVTTEKEYRDMFVDVAASDFIGADKKIYGAPLSVDSLALYYNKDLFNAAGISKPPETWQEVADIAQKLNRIDQFGNIYQSGVALGTALNINRSTDILTAMMSQVGSKINDGSVNGRVDFSDEKSRQAVDFYTSFANVGSPMYSWNARQHYSIDAFYEGALAMMVNYSWQYETIKQKNAKLNIGVVPLPQFPGTSPTNFANYWGFVVAKNKTFVPPLNTEKSATPVNLEKQNYLRTHESWQLLKFLTFKPKNESITIINGIGGTTKDFPLKVDPAKIYLEKTKKPAARRDLLETQKSDIVLSSFALGNLIAKNWYQGNPEAVEGIFAEMIESINKGEKTSQEALSAAVNRVNLTR